MPVTSRTLIDPDDELPPLASPAAVRRLALRVSARLDGLLQGEHLGHLPGPGTEPAEARAYSPGDDVRRIDWAVTARTQAPHVRQSVAERELEIIRVRLPGIEERLSRQIVAFVHELRRRDLFKLPGVAETLDWTRALNTLDSLELSPEVVNDTLGTLLKYQDDIAKIRGSEAAKILAEINMKLDHVRH